MEEEKKEGLSEVPETPPYTPSSRKRRIVAWICIVFMVLLVLMYTHSIATGAILLW